MQEQTKVKDMKGCNSIDVAVGRRIYLLRLGCGLSRQQLAKKIGITHQQWRKYEKGSNRISVNRLISIAKELGKSPAYFFEGLDNGMEEGSTQHQRMCLEVSKNFMRVGSARHREAINTLVRSLITESV